MPVSAPHVILTRPAAQATAQAAELRGRGIQVSCLPLIEIGPAPDPAALLRAWEELADEALVFFASANAAERFLAARPPSCGWPHGTLAAAPGPATAATLRAAGVPAGAVVAPSADAPSFDSEALWELLAPRTWTGRRVLLVRGEQGREWLGERLQAAGATVHAVAAYRRLPPRTGGAGLALVQRALAEPGGCWWHFSSAEALRNLRVLAPGADWSASQALATHPRIAAAARDAGFGHVAVIAPGAAPLAEAVAAAALSTGPAATDRPIPGSAVQGHDPQQAADG